MKVRMLTTKAGPDGNRWHAGQVLDRKDAKRLIEDGLAVAHKPPAKVERAVSGPQRQATED
jgi:hypothetical protein